MTTLRHLVVVMALALGIGPGAPAQAQSPLSLGPSISECLAWLADHPEFTPHFDRLPPICFWHYRGWSCVQTWTPAGWLRPGGYCDAVWVNQSLASTHGPADEPRKPDPCYPNYPGAGILMQPPTECPK